MPTSTVELIDNLTTFLEGWEVLLLAWESEDPVIAVREVIDLVTLAIVDDSLVIGCVRGSVIGMPGYLDDDF